VLVPEKNDAQSRHGWSSQSSMAEFAEMVMWGQPPSAVRGAKLRWFLLERPQNHKLGVHSFETGYSNFQDTSDI